MVGRKWMGEDREHEVYSNQGSDRKVRVLLARCTGKLGAITLAKSKGGHVDDPTFEWLRRVSGETGAPLEVWMEALDRKVGPNE
jgi:hypothetical protein